MIVFDILGFILGVAGAILLGNKMKSGFLCFMLHSVCYGVIAATDQRYGLLSTCVIFFMIDAYYYRKWQLQEKQYKVIEQLSKEAQEQGFYEED